MAERNGIAALDRAVSRAARASIRIGVRGANEGDGKAKEFVWIAAVTDYSLAD